MSALHQSNRTGVMGTIAATIVSLAAYSGMAFSNQVKITPLGSHAGEYCATDRAMLFEDPTGVRLVYDVGASVAGASDPRLGEVHVVLLTITLPTPNPPGDHHGYEAHLGSPC